MTLNVAIIASNQYTYESGWQDSLSDIADEVESYWNSDLADSSNEAVSIDTPLVSEYSDLNSDGIHTPPHDHSPEDFRDVLQNSLEYSTDFFDNFDSVIVHTTADMDTTGGIAYLGEADTNGDQAAGSNHGVGVIFDSSKIDIDPGIMTYHELLHTFAAEHSDGRRIPPGWFTGAKESVMCGNAADGCNGEYNLNPNQWETTDCTANVLQNYVDTWGL